MEHHNHHQSTKNSVEYFKLTIVLIVVAAISYAIAVSGSFSILSYMESFMGVFFIVFGGFKLLKLREFAYGFQSYDVVAKKSLTYSFSYPFLQIAFGVLYIAGQSATWLNALVFGISVISSFGVFKALRSKNDIHCVCLGNVIKLPLSTISLVEDVGMAAMAFAMFIMQA